MSLVSIIIPFHNEEYSLPGCLADVAAQTHGDFEAILVDGASTDRSAAICAEFAARDSRFKMIRTEERTGIADGRNRALDIAAGEFIQFVDADDHIPPDMTAALVEAMRAEDVDLAATGFAYLTVKDGAQHRIPVAPGISGSVLPDEYVVNCVPDNSSWPWMLGAVWNKLYSARLMRRHGIRFDVRDKSWEDILFNFKYLSNCRRVSVIERPMYEFVVETPGMPLSELTTANRYNPDRVRWVEYMGEGFERTYAARLPREWLAKCRGALGSLVIASMVNVCRRDATIPRREILNRLAEAADSPQIRLWLSNYRPEPGQSKEIPALVEKRSIRTLYRTCLEKADKRYARYMRAGAPAPEDR